MAKFALFVICALFSVAVSQNAGRYRPFRPSLTVLSSGSADGRYVSDNSGRYSANDGRYHPDDSGRYNPDGSGVYSGQNGRYAGDGSGKYSGQNEKYKGDGFGSGAGGAGGRGSGASGSAGAGGRGSGASGSGAAKSGASTTRFGSGSTGSVFGTGIRKPSVSPVSTGISAAAGFGQPVAGKQGSAAGKYDNRNYAIIRQEGHVEEDGYHYLYETENGIFGEEQGKLANRGTDAEAMRASGYFTYTGPDSIVYTVRYTADENGFVPEGDHLPTPPPIPEAIARALEYQRSQGTL